MKSFDLSNLSDRDRRRIALATRIVAPFAVVLLGLAIVGLLIVTGPGVEMDDTGAEPPRVLAFQARPTPVRRQWNGYGVVRADQAADVPARVTATVLTVPDGVEPGEPVEAGQLLVQLDPSDFERRVESAQQALAQIAAQLTQLEVEQAAVVERLALEQRDVELAEAEVARVRAVFESGAANRQDLDRAQRVLLDARRRMSQTSEAIDLISPRRSQLHAQRAAQQSALRLAQQDLERSSIRSPMAGVLQAVDVEQGESVTAGQRVARVVDPAVIEVPVRLPAAARRTLRIGDEVVVTPTAGEGEPCFTVISRMTPANDVNTRTMTAYVTVDQSRFDRDAWLAPGTFVSATITAHEPAERWVAPRRSVRAGRMLLVDDGVIRSEPVTIAFPIEMTIEELGLPDEQWVVLETFPGEPGQLVVVNAAQSLMDGARVQPVLADEARARRRGGVRGDGPGTAPPSGPSAADRRSEGSVP